MRHNKRKEEELELRYIYEGACEALKYQYTKKLWDRGNVGNKKAKKIWKYALKDIKLN